MGPSPSASVLVHVTRQISSDIVMAAAVCPTVQLPSGYPMPVVGLGTFDNLKVTTAYESDSLKKDPRLFYKNDNKGNL